MTESVEREGIRRSINEASEANLLLLIVDSRDLLDTLRNVSTENIAEKISSYFEDYQHRLNIQDIFRRTKHFVAINKGDLLEPHEVELIQRSNLPNLTIISCKTEKGISELLKLMARGFEEM
jgi:tRNA U34 5-carboxymethylaminomethyl modifying GTPase MnmE/TrmE